LKNKLALYALLISSAILGGCATSRSEVAVVTPVATGVKAPSNGRTVVIGTVKDDRVFQDAPPQPFTPSLGSGGVATATEAIKSRAVARKRNAYGQALGDVLLREGQTVQGLVRANLTAAFEQAGYRVAPSGAAAAPGAPAPTLVDVSVRKFWSWMQPGFWALTFSTNIETVLTTATPGAPALEISVSTSDQGQVGTDDAWIRAVQKALSAYQAEAAGKLGAPPF
jgi:hypothetical protein